MMRHMFALFWALARNLNYGIAKVGEIPLSKLRDQDFSTPSSSFASPHVCAMLWRAEILPA